MEANLTGTNEKQLHWYEICFYGEEDSEGSRYNPERACSYAIKTEIPDIDRDTAGIILFSRTPEHAWMRDLIAHCTCVREIDWEEAQFFDVEGLTERIEDAELGTYYTRKAG